MLRIKVKIRRIDDAYNYEALAIINSGFIGLEPEVLVPSVIEEELRLKEVAAPKAHSKVLADGRTVGFRKYVGVATVTAVTEDHETDPVRVSVLTSDTVKHVLINDKLTGKLGVVILDLGEGIWCFRKELGVKTRRTL